MIRQEIVRCDWITAEPEYIHKNTNTAIYDATAIRFHYSGFPLQIFLEDQSVSKNKKYILLMPLFQKIPLHNIQLLTDKPNTNIMGTRWVSLLGY